jgi:beta-glucanase (GH16 family)
MELLGKRLSSVVVRALAGPWTFSLLALLGPYHLAESMPRHSQSNSTAWTLTWSDEFDQPDGSPPDPKKWKVEVGGNGWGNHELEYYTNRPLNVSVQHGNLVIVARRENYVGPDRVSRAYTSARLTTQGLFSQAYGKFVARIKVPVGHGMWPAFWLMGDDFTGGHWPSCGEIDVMENIGKEPSAVHGSMHGPGYARDFDFTSTFKLPGGPRSRTIFMTLRLSGCRASCASLSMSSTMPHFSPRNFLRA